MRSLAAVLLFAAAFQGYQCQQCTTTGTICDANCNIAFCVEEGEDPFVVETCSAGNYCKKIVGEDPENPEFECSAKICSNAFTPHPYTCMKADHFPSPYDCTKYFICNGANQPPFAECTCGEKQMVDLATVKCVAMTEDKCARTPPECTKTGQNGNWEDPFCFLCDGKWNANLFKCAGAKTETPTEGSGTTRRMLMTRASPKDTICRPYQAPSTPNTPGGTTPSNPDGTTPSNPGGSNPSNPDGTTPSNPGGTTPSNPGGTTPSNPGGTTPSNPGGTTPSNPGGTTPSNPGGTTPSNPGGTTPSNPGGTTPSNPDGTTPSNPGGTTPSNPGGTTPSNPGGTTPSNPGGTTPSNPGGTTPSNPDGTTPSNPGGTTPNNPGGTTPNNPGGSTPSNPDGTTPNNPDPTPPTPTPNGSCTFVNQRLGDTTNCRRYFICDTRMNAVGYPCPRGYIFNATRRACIKGTC